MPSTICSIYHIPSVYYLLSTISYIVYTDFDKSELASPVKPLLEAPPRLLSLRGVRRFCRPSRNRLRARFRASGAADSSINVKIVPHEGDLGTFLRLVTTLRLWGWCRELCNILMPYTR